MGFELPDGKTARNIQEQVKFLTEKLKDLYAAFNQSGLKKIEIVEELPEVGNVNVLYLVPVVSPDENNYYEEYLWLDDQWEMIGTTQIDLLDYCTLSTDQTITGKKTIDSRMIFGHAAIKADENVFKIVRNSDDANLLYGNVYHIDTPTHLPLTSQFYDLGNSDHKWKDLYLSGEVRISGVNYLAQIKNDGNRLKFYYGDTERFRIGNSEIVSTNPILPNATNTYDLGSSSNAWKDLYLSGNAIFENGAALKVGTAPSLQLLSYSFRTYSFGPIDSGAYDIGYSNLKYKDIYFSGSLKDGTNSVSVAEIGKVKTVNGNAPDASGNIAVATTNGLYKHTLSTTLGQTIIIINNSNATITQAIFVTLKLSEVCSMTVGDNSAVVAIGDPSLTTRVLYYVSTFDGTVGNISITTTNPITADSVEAYS